MEEKYVDRGEIGPKCHVIQVKAVTVLGESGDA
jgi:hypothetical protein